VADAVKVVAVLPVKGIATLGSPLGAASCRGLTGSAVAAPLAVASRAIGMAIAAVSLATIDARDLLCANVFIILSPLLDAH
jgi:hypothetical protein